MHKTIRYLKEHVVDILELIVVLVLLILEETTNLPNWKLFSLFLLYYIIINLFCRFWKKRNIIENDRRTVKLIDFIPLFFAVICIALVLVTDISGRSIIMILISLGVIERVIESLISFFNKERNTKG